MKDGCKLCPRECGVNREAGELGFCRCGNTVRIARAALHFWEEPCISGKNGSGAVFFSGCNLKCIFCQNREISNECVGREASEDELADIFLRLQGEGAHNINLVTPTPWADKIKTALSLAWDKGMYIPAVYNCGGYESYDVIRSLRGYAKIYLPDFKYLDPKLSAELSGAADYPETAKKALYEMVEQRGEARFDDEGMMSSGVIVRHLVLPGQLENSFAVLKYLNEEYGDDIYISIMNQYTPMSGMSGELSRPLSREEYDSVISHARSIGIKNAFIQEGGTVSGSFIPKWSLK